MVSHTQIVFNDLLMNFNHMTSLFFSNIIHLTQCENSIYVSYQVLTCNIDTTYSKSQYQSQFLRPKCVSVSVSTFETKVKSLCLTLNLWDHSKKSQSQSWLLIPTTKSLSLSQNFWYPQPKVSVSKWKSGLYITIYILQFLFIVI